MAVVRAWIEHEERRRIPLAVIVHPARSLAIDLGSFVEHLGPRSVENDFTSAPARGLEAR